MRHRFAGRAHGAVLAEVDGEVKLYYVVETKGSASWDDLRHIEAAKSKCSEKLFAAITMGENPARYIRATRIDDMLGNVE